MCFFACLRSLTCLRFSPCSVLFLLFCSSLGLSRTDMHALCSASMDKTISLWDIKTQKRRSLLQGHDKGVFQLAYHPDYHILFSAAYETSMRPLPVMSTVLLLTLHSSHCCRGPCVEPVLCEEHLQTRGSLPPSRQRRCYSRHPVCFTLYLVVIECFTCSH